MSRYFFHTKDGRCIADEDGTELPNQGFARIEAIKLMGELLTNFPEKFWETGSLSVIVSNQDRLTLFTIDCCSADAPAMQRQPYQKPLG
jgi:hypothetical protein